MDDKYIEQSGSVISVYNNYCEVYYENIVTNSSSLSISMNILYRQGYGATLKNMVKVGSKIIRVVQQPTSNYESINVKLDDEYIAELLGLEPEYKKFMVLRCLNDYGDVTDGGTSAQFGGYWMKQNGTMCWHDDSVSFFYAEPTSWNDYSSLNIGQFPNRCAIGDEAHTFLFFVYDNKYYELDITLIIGDSDTGITNHNYPKIDPSVRKVNVMLCTYDSDNNIISKQKKPIPCINEIGITEEQNTESGIGLTKINEFDLYVPNGTYESEITFNSFSDVYKVTFDDVTIPSGGHYKIAFSSVSNPSGSFVAWDTNVQENIL
jgi:hypothetical protein